MYKFQKLEKNPKTESDHGQIIFFLKYSNKPQ